MKALRKCACVAVQLVVTTLLLFQQCPVQAIALGVERGSDYVEIPASEEDAGAENDSSEAPSNDGNSNEAAPASPEKDEAASGADSVVGADNAIQNTQSDDDATNSGDATPTSVSDEELVWNRLGTLEWSKDANKNVILRPADGAESASYEGEIRASELFGSGVKSFYSEGTISLKGITFSNCSFLEAVRFDNIALSGNSASRMFEKCGNLESLYFGSICTSNVADLSYMFYGCKSLKSIDVSAFDTSFVTTMKSMFHGCSGLRELNLSSFITSKTTDMSSMFEGCSSLLTVDLSSFDTSSVVDMGWMFGGCSQIHYLDLSSFNTSAVEGMWGMFAGCSELRSLNLTAFDTSSVTTMDSMFSGCGVGSLDVSHFDTSSVTSMNSMFEGTPLHSLDLSTFDTSSVTDMGSMFKDCGYLESIDLSSFDTSSVANMKRMFQWCRVKDLDLSSFNTSSVKSMESMFSSCLNLKSLKLAMFTTTSVDTMRTMFYDCRNLEYLDISSFDTSGINGRDSMDYLFEKCNSLTSVKLGVSCRENVRKQLPALYHDSFNISWKNSMGKSIVDLPDTFADTVHAKAKLTKGYFNVDTSDVVFTGSPRYKACASDSGLREGVDYEESYSDNVLCGKATLLITGIGVFEGDLIYHFNIVKAIPTYEIPTEIIARYGCRLRDLSLPSGFSWNNPDLSVDWYGARAVSATYTPEDTANYRTVEDAEIEVRVVRESLSVPSVDNRIFTGEKQVPSINLPGIRVVSNEGGVNVGEYSIELALADPSLDSWDDGACENKIIKYDILPASIDGADFVPISDASYTGSAIEPDVLVRFNGKTLVKGKDYDLSYSDNVKVGTARVTVTGKGNFNGKHEMTFKIVRPVITFDQDMVEGKTVSTRWTSKVNTTDYRIVLDRGGMVRIRTGFLGIDTVLCSIRNDNGDIIQSWSPSDGGDYGFFALPAGTYYFQYIGSPKPYGGSVYASYSVTRFGEPANTIYEVEDNNGTADGHTIAGDATPVEVGCFFAGSNYYATTGGFGDIDYFKFTVARRGRYSMSLATNARLVFALTDAQGNILNNRDTGSSIVAQCGSEQLTGLDFGTLEPGTYYVRVLSTDLAAIGSPYSGYIFDSSEPEPAKGGVGRVSGDTRYDTMASLAGRGNWAVGGSVILASGANYPDALAASSLSGGLDAPILLTDPNGLSDAARGRLESLCPSKVFIVGGNAAVSPDVERQVKELLGFGCAVFRVAGQTRYETSLVAAEINPKSSDTVIVATGGNYADALSVSPYAFASGSPVLLCDSASGLAGAAVESIRSGGYSRAVIVGGTAAVPASVEGQLQSAGIRDVTRLSGATRFETSSRIADFELASGLGFTMDGVLLATGMNFPDALSAGPLAGRSRSPLLLVDPGAEYACAYLSGFRGEVSSATVVGGTAAVPEEDRLAIARVLGI